MRLIECDLCHCREPKPHGTPPDNWFAYSKSRQSLDLCPSCVKIVRHALGGPRLRKAGAG